MKVERYWFGWVVVTVDGVALSSAYLFERDAWLYLQRLAGASYRS